jgi:hypothetical protein
MSVMKKSWISSISTGLRLKDRVQLRIHALFQGVQAARGARVVQNEGSLGAWVLHDVSRRSESGRQPVDSFHAAQIVIKPVERFLEPGR